MTALPSTPAEMQAYILERLVGDTAEPDKVLDAAGKLAAHTARAFGERLASLLAAPLSVEVGSVALARIAEIGDHLSGDGFLLLPASGPNAPEALLMLMDAAALTLLVNAMFGGDSGVALAPIAREPSPIEAEVGSAMLEELGEVLSEGGLDLSSPLAAPLSGPPARKASFRDGPAVRISLRVRAPASAGDIHLFVVQRLLIQRRDAAPAEAGTEWGPRIGEEIMRSGVQLEAVMPLGRLTLGAIAAFTPGAVIPMDAGAQTQARLLVRGRILYLCEFGRLGAQYTVRVREPWSEARDFMDGLLPD